MAQKITCYVVQTPNHLYGPFDTAEAASKWLEQHYNSLAAPQYIAAVKEPFDLNPR